MKKLDTVSVTAGNESSCASTSSADDEPTGSDAPGPGPAHDERLSFLSRDPFLVIEAESPPKVAALALVRFSCSMAAALDFRSRLLEAVESESESPGAVDSVLPLMMFCNQIAVQAKGMRYFPRRLQASYALARTLSMLI